MRIKEMLMPSTSLKQGFVDDDDDDDVKKFLRERKFNLKK